MRLFSGVQGKATRRVGGDDADKVQGYRRVRLEKKVAHPSGLTCHKETQDLSSCPLGKIPVAWERRAEYSRNEPGIIAGLGGSPIGPGWRNNCEKGVSVRYGYR